MTDAEFDAAIAALAPWVGRTRIVEDEIGLSSARRIAGMLDMDPASITQGMALPPHWFTMFFPISRSKAISARMATRIRACSCRPFRCRAAWVRGGE